MNVLNGNQGFSRKVSNIIFSRGCHGRKKCRLIDEILITDTLKSFRREWFCNSILLKLYMILIYEEY